MILMGHFLRIGAKFTAAKLFTHLVRYELRKEDTLSFDYLKLCLPHRILCEMKTVFFLCYLSF